MALPRSWSFPNYATTTDTSTTTTIVSPSSNAPGFNLGADSIQVPTLVTAPPNSSLVTSFPAQAASVSQVVQNSLGYDAQFVGYLNQTSASVATYAIGVGATSAPVMTTVASSFTSAVDHLLTFPAYVPSGYYYSMQIVQANAAGVGGTVTVVATPV